LTTTRLSNVAGLPIEGSPVFSRGGSGEQWGEDKFSELLRPLVESPRVEAIRWEQYTPYFNDGDICEFGVRAPEIKVNDRPEAEDDEWGEEYHSVYSDYIAGGRRQRWVPSGPRSWDGSYEPYGDEIPQHEDYDALNDLSSAMERGRFDDFLYDAFGDHAQVTVYSDRITVATYDHE
jgi:hypothetical protein